ncbi:hypothetical protein JL721_8186 [Aureococcus anophagefferens]|nr:hypothetical protein JL721_8186 [Aureococcus anophagefferens]
MRHRGVRRLAIYLAALRRRSSVCPPYELTFAAFNACTLSRVNVVIIGQDPYPTPGHAHGLAFSLAAGARPRVFPKSLQNIFDELRGPGPPRPPDAWKGDLTNWALREDVLLLNAALTYCEDDKKGQQKKGWEIVTRAWARAATTTAGDGGKPAPPKRRRSKGPKGPGHRPNPKKSKPKVKVKVDDSGVAAPSTRRSARPPRLKSRAARDITALLRYQTEMRRVDGDDGGDGGDGGGGRRARAPAPRADAASWLDRARGDVVDDEDSAFQSAFVEDASALQLIVTTIVAGESASESAVNVSAWDSNHHAEHMGILALARAEVARPSDEDPPPMVSFPQVACDECRAT